MSRKLEIEAALFSYLRHSLGRACKASGCHCKLCPAHCLSYMEEKLKIINDWIKQDKKIIYDSIDTFLQHNEGNYYFEEKEIKLLLNLKKELYNLKQVQEEFDV